MKLIVMKLFSPHFEWSVCVCVCVEGKRAIDKTNSTGWSLNWFQMDYWFANIAQLVAAHGFPSGHWISIRDTDYYSDNRNRIKLGINCVSPCVEPLLHPPAPINNSMVIRKKHKKNVYWEISNVRLFNKSTHCVQFQSDYIIFPLALRLSHLFTKVPYCICSTTPSLDVAHKQ